MSIIVPTILATDVKDYTQQLENIAFAEHIHIDFMDGSMTDTISISLAEASWADDVTVDLHVMYDKPHNHLDQLIKMQPNMVIVQAECHSDVILLATKLKAAGIKTGLSIQPETTPQSVKHILPHIQHVLIFSGNLGHFGGQADLVQLNKIDELKEMHHWLEFGWDGGANIDNVRRLSEGGIDVINVGGAIQKADNASQAYQQLAKQLNKPL